MQKDIILDGEITNYIITDEGEVINKKTNRKLKIGKNGVVQLSFHGQNRGKMVARLVAEAFLPNPDTNIYLYATNIDGNKENNRLENIKWITGSENSNNVWDKRRENGTIKPIYEKSENIVEKSEKFVIEENEKRIYIDNEETPYVINKEGRIRNLKTGNILKGSILATYPTVNLRWNGKQKNKAIHRLVAETWIPNPDNLPIVDHIDGNRLNYKIDNLRWVSYKENSNNIHKKEVLYRPINTRPIFSEEELKNEKWLFNDKTKYMVSNLGRVKGKRKEIIQGTIADCGYVIYALNNANVLGHILVWETFNQQEKPKDLVINHINGNKMDNRLINLELVTQKENMQKAASETNAWDFRKVIEMDEKGNILREFNNASEAAKAIGIKPSSMRNTIRRNGRCYNGLRYKYIEN